jgi:hypothetical protein
MATERCSDLQYPQRELTRRWGSPLRTGVIGIVTAVALGLPAVVRAQEHVPRAIRGPHVFAASFSGGQLHETLTIDNPGAFVAHILASPPSHPTGSRPLHGRTVSLGHHTAGKTHISFRLGTLNPGRYAVVVTHQPPDTTTNPSRAATWVYLTVHNNGKITDIKLIHP